jgi:hypothetical protein
MIRLCPSDPTSAWCGPYRSADLAPRRSVPPDSLAARARSGQYASAMKRRQLARQRAAAREDDPSELTGEVLRHPWMPCLGLGVLLFAALQDGMSSADASAERRSARSGGWKLDLRTRTRQVPCRPRLSQRSVDGQLGEVDLGRPPGPPVLSGSGEGDVVQSVGGQGDVNGAPPVRVEGLPRR